MLHTLRAMPKSSGEWLVRLLIVATFVLLGIGMYVHLGLKKSNDSNTHMLLGGTRYSIEIVITEAAKQQGLSGRTSLAPQSGMLFSYEAMGKRCLWMKDMRFTIDMLWLSADKQITHIEPSVAPATYPRTYCAEAQYLVEVADGTAATLGLKTGDQVDF